MKAFLIGLALLLTVPAQVSAANAAIVTATFDALPAFFAARSDTSMVGNFNYTEAGFRFSPDCHFDRLDWMGFDMSGCGGSATYNSDFLGPEEYQVRPGDESGHGVLFVDRGGRPFTLLSLVQVTRDWWVTSSKGGYFRAGITQEENDSFAGLECFETGCPITRIFAGPEWTGIKWLLFNSDGSGAPEGFDSLTARAPISVPGALLLLGGGLASMYVGRGSRMRRLESSAT